MPLPFYAQENVRTPWQSEANFNRNLAYLGNYGPAAAIAAGAGEGSAQARAYQGGGGGNYGSGTNSFLANWQDQYNQAKATNQQRYSDILGGAPAAATPVASPMGGRGSVGAPGGGRSAGAVPQQAAPALTQDQIAANGGYVGRYGRAMGLLEKLGGQQKADAAQRYDQQTASMQQDLTSRGLAGTTILPTMKLGVQREKSDALNRIDQQITQQRMNADASLSGDTLNFMERRTDQYPNEQLYAQMAQQYGQAGGGQPSYASMGGMGMDVGNSLYGMPGGGGGGYIMPQGLQDGSGRGGGFNYGGVGIGNYISPADRVRLARGFGGTGTGAPLIMRGGSVVGGGGSSVIDPAMSGGGGTPAGGYPGYGTSDAPTFHSIGDAGMDPLTAPVNLEVTQNSYGGGPYGGYPTDPYYDGPSPASDRAYADRIRRSRNPNFGSAFAGAY
jgi:hypothetical protein